MVGRSRDQIALCIKGEGYSNGDSKAEPAAFAVYRGKEKDEDEDKDGKKRR